MYKDMDIELEIAILTRKFADVVKRKMCEAVAYGVLDILTEDIVICYIYPDGSYDRLYSMANFLKERADELPQALRDWLVREFGAFMSEWELRARQEKQNEEDMAKESQWEANS